MSNKKMTEPETAKDYPIYPISVAAKLLNISVHTLRMYEREGLIVPFKKESNQRLYSQEDLDRINCIRNEIKTSKISINGIKTIYSMIPCWDIVKCTKKEREKCGSFNGSNSPCWTYNHNLNVCGTKKCRDCIVYSQYSECNNVKELIKSSAT
jgi:MerR family transcriptional regulator, heat shock protein HspR